MEVRKCPCCRPYAEEALKLLDYKAHSGAHQQIIDLFCRVWNECRGGRYLVQGGKDGRAVKMLLEHTHDLSEVEARLRRAFRDPWFKQNASIALFASRWNAYEAILR